MTILNASMNEEKVDHSCTTSRKKNITDTLEKFGSFLKTKNSSNV